MRYVIFLFLAGLLSGCGDDLSDVREFVQSVKESYRPQAEPLPEIPEFTHIQYTAQVVRSPFVEPDPEAIKMQTSIAKDCLMPDAGRKRHPLERFALDDIQMRGSLGRGEELYALVQAQDSSIFKVQVDDYLGLFHGRVISVSTSEILLEEMVPEGDGCWSIRKNKLELTSG